MVLGILVLAADKLCPQIKPSLDLDPFELDSQFLITYETFNSFNSKNWKQLIHALLLKVKCKQEN